MYVRTPKRYRRTARRSIFPWRRLFFWGLAILLIVLGVGVYQNRGLLAPIVNEAATTLVANIEAQAGTMMAPTPTPTRDPASDLVQADNFWAQGSTSEALRLYMNILDAVPNDVNAHYRVTMGLISQGDVERALDYAERTVTANPFSSDAWALRAWTLDWNRRHGEAIASALYARELDPENARAQAYLAEAYFGAGQTQRALNAAERALEMDPNRYEAYRARGYIRWLGLFDLDAALSDFRMGYNLAVEENPAAAGLLAVDIAQVQIGQQNNEGALQTLQAVLELNPQNTQALYWIGWIYFSRLGDPERANSFLLRCVEYNPDSINCNYMLGRSQERLDQISLAAESLARAVELGTTSARHYWWAGRTQISLGNCTRALEYLRVGYDLALREANSELVQAYDDILPLCQADFGRRVAPTPTITLTPSLDEIFQTATPDPVRTN